MFRLNVGGGVTVRFMRAVVLAASVVFAGSGDQAEAGEKVFSDKSRAEILGYCGNACTGLNDDLAIARTTLGVLERACLVLKDDINACAAAGDAATAYKAELLLGAERCLEAVREKWWSGAGRAFTAARRGLEALREAKIPAKSAVGSGCERGSKCGMRGTDIEKGYDLETTLTAAARLRKMLGAAYEEVNALRDTVKACGIPGNAVRLAESKKCVLTSASAAIDGLRERAKRERACLARTYTAAQYQLDEERAAYRQLALSTKVACQGLVATAIEEACAAYPNVCKVLRDARACYVAAVASSSRAVDFFAKVASVVATPISGATIANAAKAGASLMGALEAAAAECRAWIGRGVETVISAVCAAGAGKVACDVIRDAKACYRSALEAERELPKRLVDALTPWVVFDLGTVTTVFVNSFLAPKVRAAVDECKSWLASSAVKVGQALCEGNSTCDAFLKSLKAAGVTSDNWRKKVPQVALLAARAAFPAGTSRSVTVSAEIAASVSALLGVKAGGVVVADVSRTKDDVYSVALSLTRAAAATASVRAGAEQKAQVAIGASHGESMTIVLNAADPKDWRALLSFGVGVALRMLLEETLGVVGRAFVGISEALGNYLAVVVPWDARVLSRSRFIVDRGCDVCVTGDLGGKLGIRTLKLEGGFTGQLCVEGKFDRAASTLTLGVKAQGGASGKVEIPASVAKLIERVSGVVKAVSKWVAEKLAEKATGAIANALAASASFGGRVSLAYSGVTWPRDTIRCGVDTMLTAIKGRTAKVAQEWAIDLTWGSRETTGVSIVLTTDVGLTRGALDVALLALGPIGTLANVLRHGKDSDIVAWRVAATTGKTKAVEAEAPIATASASVVRGMSVSLGDGTWTLKAIRTGTLTGALRGIAGLKTK